MSRVPAPRPPGKTPFAAAQHEGPRAVNSERRAADAPRPRPVGWRIFGPALLLIAAAAAWSGFWFYAAAKAEEAVDVFLKREAARGRVYACGERAMRGYPFRIELDCGNVTARLPGEGGETLASAPRFVALAQVYDPMRLIGELTGPVAITAADGTRADLSFSLAQASAHIDGRRMDRGSLAVAAPRLLVDQQEVAAAKAFEAHLRRTPDGQAGAWDLAASVDGADSPYLALLPAGEGPVAAELQIEARGVGELEPGPLSERLRAFAANGGEVKVAVARLTRGDLAAQAKGDLALDPQGRMDGRLDVTARGIDEIVRSLTGGEEGDGVSALFGLGAKMLGKPAELDGRPASTYRVKFDKGRVTLGPIKLTRIPPAF